MATGRSTANRDRFRKEIAKDKPPCYLQDIGRCLYPGQPIDYDAPHTDPLSFQIDHVVSIDADGTDTLDNIGATHRGCNRDKSNKPLMIAGVTYVTERTW